MGVGRPSRRRAGSPTQANLPVRRLALLWHYLGDKPLRPPGPPRPIQPDGRLHGVIVAITHEDGRLLMIRRAGHLRAGGKVCFPGGAIELGELPMAAAAREMKEELGIDISDLMQVWEWDSSTGPLKLYGF